MSTYPVPRVALRVAPAPSATPKGTCFACGDKCRPGKQLCEACWWETGKEETHHAAMRAAAALTVLDDEPTVEATQHVCASCGKGLMECVRSSCKKLPHGPRKQIKVNVPAARCTVCHELRPRFSVHLGVCSICQFSAATTTEAANGAGDVAGEHPGSPQEPAATFSSTPSNGFPSISCRGSLPEPGFRQCRPERSLTCTANDLGVSKEGVEELSLPTPSEGGSPDCGIAEAGSTPAVGSTSPAAGRARDGAPGGTSLTADGTSTPGASQQIWAYLSPVNERHSVFIICEPTHPGAVRIQ